jgi:hypothetical protein
MARKIYPAATSEINSAAAAYAAARDALEAAETAKSAAAAALLAAMQTAQLDCAATDSGKVTISAGRRTVKVVDPALSAEIKLIQERGVRTGRAVENVGDPYAILRS